MFTTLKLLFAASVALSVGAFPACSSSQTRVTDVQQLNQRLQGVWLLQSYRPSVPLEMTLQGMLQSQLGQMQVLVNGTQVVATGPGVSATRNYQIEEVLDQTATLVVSEPSGVSVRVWIEIRDRTLTFRPLSAPWSGEGTLQRL